MVCEIICGLECQKHEAKIMGIRIICRFGTNEVKNMGVAIICKFGEKNVF